jgi:hypothetical protein
MSLDFSGGHGILTRIMRGYGFNFFHYDESTENLFASGFDRNLSKNTILLQPLKFLERK